jgi:glyoxylase-like metal-dependent hydrolase (beta-lactamase superfamily II)
MKLHVVDTGFFKLDGGAMFGVVPKSIWQKTNPADENNMCTWAMRCLLLEEGNRLVLIDTGIGTKQDAKFFSHYYLHGEDTLDKSLHSLGFGREDITDVFLTHLHFDHCGGGTEYRKGNQSKVELSFPKARYWSNSAHWEWATKPNRRERASFLTENIVPIKESGHLHFVEDTVEALPFEILYMNGHTEKQMLPKIKVGEQTIVFVADLLPSVGHLPVPFVMGYDTRPLLTLDEKEQFLKEAQANGWTLFFEHDPVNQCCNLVMTDKGIRAGETFRLAELTGM